MSRLAQLQQTFQYCVLHPGDERKQAWISAAGRADPVIQLGIYTHAYSARLTEVLADDFPALHMALGDDAFERLADEYIAGFPSQYFSLRDFGGHLPAFIAALGEQHAQHANRHWLAELAQFEWCLGEAFDAADTPLFSEQEMAAVPPQQWPQLCFILHPSVQRLDLRWNTVAMWQALTADDPQPLEAIPGARSAWLIWRQRLVTRFRSLADDEQPALDCLREGGSFDDICQQLALSIDAQQVPMRAAGLLKGWIGQGLISGLE